MLEPEWKLPKVVKGEVRMVPVNKIKLNITHPVEIVHKVEMCTQT